MRNPEQNFREGFRVATVAKEELQHPRSEEGIRKHCELSHDGAAGPGGAPTTVREYEALHVRHVLVDEAIDVVVLVTEMAQGDPSQAG